AHRAADGLGKRTVDTDDGGKGPQARENRLAKARRSIDPLVVASGFSRTWSRRDQETAAPRVGVADHFESCHRVLRPIDDDVLQQVAETGLDGALAAWIDLEI